ncbi:hypothetical protein BDN71DRAFT_1509055 [Pleurotus eryngii]|uniref:Uncharacterized protein n=1 Tax=Pleurotus eryngii TaxID=5323 RepID=A0A9P5ZSM2_PLEER|nr:hypothetical protein BDN71DRAFT_1509055 [Pleurotus eryngii]
MSFSLSINVSAQRGYNINRFRHLRSEFLRIAGVHEELDAYGARDSQYAYQILSGLVPMPLVGKVTNGVGPAWQMSDTFFTDFPDHNAPDRVLSSTNGSYIICNVACYDKRLYSSDIDPSSTDRSAAAGMSYMHLLVIPSSKLYNAVALSDSDAITEMRAHFLDFWDRDGSISKIINAIHTAMERRYADVARAYQMNNSSTASERIARLDVVMSGCRRSAANFANMLRASKNNADLVFGFHPHPHHSVGHLHMHVLLHDLEFRKYSTLEHDWKTIPFGAVEHVLDEEAEPKVPGGWPRNRIE